MFTPTITRANLMETARLGHLVPTDEDTAAVADQRRCPRCGRVGLNVTSWLVAGELETWFGCPECYAVQSI